MSFRHPRRDAIYLTLDGLLTPLGYSQVVRVVEGLARRGFAYHIVSLERSADAADKEHVQRVKNHLKRAGVGWSFVEYRGRGGASSAVRNLGAVLTHTLGQVVYHRPALIHSRGYQSTIIARVVRRLTGVPYLFDARGYWIDECREERRWFNDDRAFAAAKRLERDLYRNAAGLVTLTALQRDDIVGGAFGAWGEKPASVITTVADFDEFVLEPRDRVGAVDGALRERLANRLVVCIVGSLNISYCVGESLLLYRHIADLRADAHLLVLSSQTEQWSSAIKDAGIAEGRYDVTQAQHVHMAEWLSLVRWGLLLLRSPFAKRGSMPTKLAEFFAAGVRPIQYGCNLEVGHWIKHSGSGVLLDSLSESDLRAAAERVASTPHDTALLHRARENTRDHFSLQAGLDRYAELLSKLLPAPHTGSKVSARARVSPRQTPYDESRATPEQRPLDI